MSKRGIVIFGIVFLLVLSPVYALIFGTDGLKLVTFMGSSNFNQVLNTTSNVSFANITSTILCISGSCITNFNQLGSGLNITSITWSDGVFNITWSNNQSFLSPNLTGPQGLQGLMGTNGTNGVNGINGLNGTNGINGTDGQTWNITSITWSDGVFNITWSNNQSFLSPNLTGPQGLQGLMGTNGTNGVNGLNGTNGVNGQSSNISVINDGGGVYTWKFYYENGTNYANFTTDNLTGPQGLQGLMGTNGTNGVNGLNGTDGQATNISVVNNGGGVYLWRFYYENGTNYANFTTDNLTGPQGLQGLMGTNGTNGLMGTNGTNGVNGLNGTSFSVSGIYLYDNGSNVIFFNETPLQSFNDTVFIQAVNNTHAWIGNCSAGQVVMNLTTGGPICVSDINSSDYWDSLDTPMDITNLNEPTAKSLVLTNGTNTHSLSGYNYLYNFLVGGTEQNYSSNTTANILSIMNGTSMVSDNSHDYYNIVNYPELRDMLARGYIGYYGGSPGSLTNVTLSNYYEIFIDAPTQSGNNITKYYGIFINQPNGGTTSWDIWGDGQSHFTDLFISDAQDGRWCKYTDADGVNCNEVVPATTASVSAVNNTHAWIGNCSAGQVVMNLTTGGPVCVASSVDTNETPRVNSLNQSLIDEIANRQGNVTALNNTHAWIGNCSSGQVVMNMTTNGPICGSPALFNLTPQLQIYLTKYQYCYQESVNISNQTGLDTCSLNYTGGYYAINETNAGIIYINYSKPNNVYGAIWQLSEGTTGAYNLTIPSQCMDTGNDVMLMIVQNATGIVYGRQYCYNYTSSSWLVLPTPAISGSAADNFPDAGFPDEIFDGNWSSNAGADRVGTASFVRWSIFSAGMKNSIYEEAMWWNTSQPGTLYLNGILNVSSNIYQNNGQVANVGTCPAGQVVMNTTYSGVQCSAVLSSDEVNGNINRNFTNALGNITSNITIVNGNIANNISAVNNTHAWIGNCSAGTFAVNLTTGGPMCGPITVTSASNASIDAINSTLYTEIGNRERNDTGIAGNIAGNATLINGNIANNVTALNNTHAWIGNCSAGQLVMNLTTGGPMCSRVTAASNASIDAINGTLTTEIGNRERNDTAINGNIAGNATTLNGNIDRNLSWAFGNITGNVTVVNGNIDRNFTNALGNLSANMTVINGNIARNISAVNNTHAWIGNCSAGTFAVNLTTGGPMCSAVLSASNASIDAINASLQSTNNMTAPVGSVVAWLKTFNAIFTSNATSAAGGKLIDSNQTRANFTRIAVGSIIANKVAPGGRAWTSSTGNWTYGFVKYVDNATMITVGNITDGTNMTLFILGNETYTIYTSQMIPFNWVECNGQVLSDAASIYNGITLPDLNGFASKLSNNTQRFLRGSTASGATGGEDYHNLTVTEMPIHSHTSNDGASLAASAGSSIGGDAGNTGNAGGNQFHENRPPYYEIVWIMRVK